MILISTIYDDVALDNVNSASNGNLSFQQFNRLSRRAELRMLNFLSGGVDDIKLPIPYTVQLLKDILAPMIEKYSVNADGGEITRPSNYYAYDSMVLLGNYKVPIDCEDEDTDVVVGCNTVIELLDSAQFDMRCRSDIEDLQPSLNKPIAKMVGRNFEFAPTDIGSVKLQYLRYPIFGKIISKMDTVYNEEVVDEDLSTNYEYDEFAREMLVFWITQEFSVHTREQALMQANMVEGKSART